MKHIIYLFLLAITLAFAGCGNNQGAAGQDETSQHNDYDIKIQKPIVFSINTLTFGSGETLYVNIEMINGQYYYDEVPGALQGSNWNGQYQIRVYTNEFDFESIVFLAPIAVFDDQPMRFNDEFSLMFDDYNDDGSLEFTLGQYASSNGYEYALFSISPAGDVTRLNTGGAMFISNADYSIYLDKRTNTSFITSAYDNVIGETVETIYQWKDNQFVSEK